MFDLAREELKHAQQGAESQLGMERPSVLSPQHFMTFCGQLRYTFRLISEEKEILFFAALQWFAIGIAYLLWVQMLDWIPDEVWQEVAKEKQDDDATFALLNLALLGWSFLVVAVVSYPISLFSAAMVAAHYLRSAGEVSTVGRCLGLASRHLGRLWVFTTIDAWLTVRAILDRLPKKRDRRTGLEELVYYAWKIGTAGVLPALVAGKGYFEAAKDSLALLKKQPARMVGIRMGYSLLCWIVGVGAYAGAIYYFFVFGGAQKGTNEIYHFYFMMVVPIFIAAGVVSVLIRPFFLIMTAKLYTDNLPVTLPKAEAGEKPGGGVLLYVFVVLLGAVAGSVLFDQQLDVAGWVESLATKDLERMRGR